MSDFQIFPRAAGLLFEDDDIAVHAFHGSDHQDFTTYGSLFFAVAEGFPVIAGHPVSRGMYGCLPYGASFVSSMCRTMIVDAKRFPSIFMLAGPIEEQGRLRYINGCTDTGLIMPYRQGDPCLNALFFPAGTLQTPHTHPSHRIGLIYSGEGYCLTDQGETPMRQGDMFIIPAHALHWFKTEDRAMRIMVFHPDSEFGPTDEHHQMLDATLIDA